MSTLTSCNTYYPGDISCNLFTECLYQNCPICIDFIALSGCSVLSTILSTQTSINSYYPVDTACNLFAEFISKTDLSALLSCFNWLFCIIDYLVYTDYTVHIDDFNWFPHWMSCLERLPYLHWLYSLSGCSVLSTILSTQTSINSYYPDDIPCNLFTKCLFQRIALFALTFLFLLVVLLIYYHVHTDFV